MWPSLHCFSLIGSMLLIGFLGNPSDQAVWAHEEATLSVTFLGDVRLDRLGPAEPSGVTWGISQKGKPRLWVVSDDTPMVYLLKEKARVDGFSTWKNAGSFSLPSDSTELEGVTMDASRRAVLVQEGTNRVIRLEKDTFKEVESVALSQMTGFASIQESFARASSNKGLEGIAWNASSETFFMVKEGKPPLLIEVHEDLSAILRHWVLDEERGFSVPGLPQEKLDMSGIGYDTRRDLLWLVSDKGQSLFVYDYHRHRVLQRFPLGFSAGREKGIGTYRRIKKAEGVAISPDGESLFVVSDKEARLFVFAIRN